MRSFLRPGRSAFTLMEMLLVVSLLSVIGLGIFQAVNSGVKIWDRNRQAVIDEDVAIFLDRLSRDLRNALPYSLLTFTGQPERIAFPSLVRARMDAAIAGDRVDYMTQIGMLEYAYDPITRRVLLRQANYGQALKEAYSVPRVLLTAISGMTLTYWYAGPDGRLAPQAEGEETLPAGVMVELRFDEPGGGIRTVRRLIHIPVSG